MHIIEKSVNIHRTIIENHRTITYATTKKKYTVRTEKRGWDNNVAGTAPRATCVVARGAVSATLLSHPLFSVLTVYYFFVVA